MAAVMDDYMDAPMDADDVFPCKGCGEILEEGKAFELAGNRWHLDCFRCNTCGTLLDSDANLLLLGDGSLICNNCTYSCSACGNKIEDLAILTGDQAFCATCFRCRNCKRKIENLRYARTSQGIFCMGCHETLMARRRKKSKAAAAAKSREKEQSPMITEKSLPALPPSVLPTSAFSNSRPDPDSDTPNELSPKYHSSSSNKQVEPSSSSKSGNKPSKSSPEWQPEASSKQDGLTLPASSYRKNRNSAIISGSASASASASGADANDAGDGFLISVGLDTNPAQTSTPKSASDSAGEAPSKKKDKEFFGGPRSAVSEKRSDSHPSTPHIAFQEKGRRKSTDQDTPQMKSAARNAARADAHQNKSASEDFKLQDAPKLKSAGSRSISSQSSMRNELDLITSRSGILQGRKDASAAGASHDVLSPRMSVDSKAQDDEEIRASLDQLARSAMRTDSSKAIARKELPAAATRSDNAAKSGSAARASLLEDAVQTPPPRSDLPDQGSSDNYMQPRTAPAPPAGQSQPASSKEAAAAAAADSKDGLGSPVSPKLPKWNGGADFSLEDDMARILGNEEGGPNSILRRVSNAVRHGRTGSVESSNHPPSRGNHTRSISETTRATGSPRWPKTPHADDPNGFSNEISSPLSVASPESPAAPRRQLRTSEQRMAELERQFNAEREIKKRLLEKRKTISLVDLQSDIFVKQLEVLSGYIERAKETKVPVDPRDLEESSIKELIQKLDIVKQIVMQELQEIQEERDHLVDEKEQAVAERDRALMEFEQLSSKNAQLADMNNDLTHQIQERFKSQIGGDGKGPNGLGIYAPPKLSSVVLADSASITTSATLVPDEDTVVESGPTVVQVRKGQVKKFNWKKGSKTMAQNVAKGVNRAVVAFQNDRERIQQQGMGGDSIGLPYNMTIAQVEAANVPLPTGAPGQVKQPLHHHQQPPFGFFGKKNNTGSKGAIPNAAFAPIVAESPTILFGSELAERCEYEHRQIPNVVTRCIEEVELRGMDQEGIYRKTGGNSQINMIKDGFDKNESFDISDPDLDITAVTSVLKQYFRRLPTPLLTFEVYERVLESVAIADDAERCVHLNRTFSSMPQSHRDCLEFLMFHLHRVAQREPENLMSPKNLAVVFAPTIMRDMSIEREMTDMHAKNIAVQFVIENTHRIFEEE
ncbi:Rho-type GTPase-activating protein 1 [Escovopsis weberi]|uniref:Rho-type GTPase-activating protein 1 n=1 Tax=Escovopsis weberi TaxID=150374 RepID=A0A0M9VST2_ESCWE|nr:Rho-type GTPase-activating protein 1 [Escovopsis weberi]